MSFKGKRNLMLSFLLLVIIGVLVACAGGGGESTETTTGTGGDNEDADTGSTDGELNLTLGHVVAEDTGLDQGARHLAELIKEKSNGEINIEVYANASLGDNRELLESMQNGSVDMMTPALAPLASFTDATALLDLPYLFKSDENAEAVLDGEIGQSILEALEDAGFVGLAWFTQGWRHITLNSDDELVGDPS